jgi:hypothetical protein
VVAQLAERQISNLLVGGSTPPRDSFAPAVTGSTLCKQPNPTFTEVSMSIPWADIFALVLEMIENCEPDPAKRVGLLRRPKGLQALRFERGVRERMNKTPREWRQEGPGIMAEIYAARDEATDVDLKELADRCECAA